jgi:hypothetical protein
MYHFSINIFIRIRSQSYTLETVSLFKTTSFTNLEEYGGTMEMTLLCGVDFT